MGVLLLDLKHHKAHLWNILEQQEQWQANQKSNAAPLASAAARLAALRARRPAMPFPPSLPGLLPKGLPSTCRCISSQRRHWAIKGKEAPPLPLELLLKGVPAICCNAAAIRCCPERGLRLLHTDSTVHEVLCQCTQLHRVCDVTHRLQQILRQQRWQRHLHLDRPTPGCAMM